MEKCMEQHIKYLKQSRPKRWKFLIENADNIKSTSTLDEVKSVYNYITNMFESEPNEINTFNYLVWNKLGYKIMIK